jgi:hypothetical protein
VNCWLPEKKPIDPPLKMRSSKYKADPLSMKTP